MEASLAAPRPAEWSARERAAFMRADFAATLLPVRQTESWLVSTDETEIFSALIGEVYDAALDPGVWPAALAKIVAYVGGDAAVLAIREISNRTAGPTYSFNSSEAVTDAYNLTYIKLDPTFIGFNLAQIGDAISTDDVLPYAEFVETRFYKEFAVPQGWVDSVGLLVDRSPTWATVMCVLRGFQQGLADADAKRRARLVGPHLRRAVVIGRQLAHHKARADDLASAVDGIGAAFFLVDGVGRLQHVNHAGVEALERGSPYTQWRDDWSRVIPRQTARWPWPLPRACGATWSLASGVSPYLSKARAATASPRTYCH